MSKKVAIIVGSLREGSYAHQIAKIAANMFDQEFETEFVEIRDLPLYDADYDNEAMTHKPLPESYTVFRNKIKEADGVLFVTPENNRTIPACLKNAVDIGSKPNGDVAWTKTPAGIISHSVGAMGGYSSHKNLRLALSYFNMPITQQPEVFLGHSPELLKEDGSGFKTESTTQFVQGYIDLFQELIRKNPKK